ncbi:hypothetical protein RFM41_29350 [Mesorhizobium sp. VK25A]|uniref:Lysis protein n=1 Tax=Mesorhizobium vachelliae TaxID=3072309 RepID=A0ABU5A443_9HYPH|nr:MULTISPECIES: hypothetical protein [unclassified Mesorhizobium]MDX8532470.1 hypothetical protein [Mesorhizobium sp. VK25D]MDX8547884.1 hypothetical protein [Mesorhizobium sp. VK25A]
MRTLLFLIAFAASFLIWDRLANDGSYIATLEHSLKDARERLI